MAIPRRRRIRFNDPFGRTSTGDASHPTVGREADCVLVKGDRLRHHLRRGPAAVRRPGRHGGLERWSGIQTLTARLSLGGPFWAAKGWPDIFVDETVELDAQREHIVFTPFAAADRRSVFDVDPERIVIQGADGEVVERRDNPRASFAGFDASTPWDALLDACLAETRAVWRIDH